MHQTDPMGHALPRAEEVKGLTTYGHFPVDLFVVKQNEKVSILSPKKHIRPLSRKLRNCSSSYFLAAVPAKFH